MKGECDLNSKLAEAMADLNEYEVNRLVHERVRASEDAIAIIEELRDGLDVVGQRYKSGDYFLAELMFSAEIFKNAISVVEPIILKVEHIQVLGKMVMGTVLGDIHDVGKNIAATILQTAGFEVFDLGVDVGPQAFVQELRDTGASILGLSGLLTVSFESMKKTVDAVVAAGLRPSVKIIIGGGTVTERVRQYAGADAYTNSAFEGTEICRQFVLELSTT